MNDLDNRLTQTPIQQGTEDSNGSREVELHASTPARPADIPIHAPPITVQLARALAQSDSPLYIMLCDVLEINTARFAAAIIA